MSKPNGSLSLSVPVIDVTRVYRDNFDNELISGQKLSERINGKIATACAVARAEFANYEPATPEEEAAYLAGLIVTIEELRQDFQAELARLTGCYVTVEVGVHPFKDNRHDLFAASASVEAAKYGTNKGCQWRRLGGGSDGGTSIYGPSLPAEAE
jgi:GGDEF domain-containing protein